MSLKQVLIATAIIPVILFCLLFTISFWRRDMRRAHQDTEKLLAQSIRVQNERIESYLSRIEEVCGGAASMLGKKLDPDGVDALTPKDVYDYLTGIISARPEVSGAGIAFYPKYRKTDGEPFFHYAAYRRGTPQEGNLVIDNLDMSDRPYLQGKWFTEAAKQRKGVWGKPTHYIGLGAVGRDDSVDGWAITYSLPLMWGDEVLGVVVVGTSVEKFSHSFNYGMDEVGYDAYCAVLGPEGTYYFHPDFNHVASGIGLQNDLKDEGDGPASARTLFSNHQRGISRVKSTCDTNDRWLAMMQAPLSFIDWTTVVFLPEDNFFAPVRAQLYTGIAWIVGAALIAMGIALYGLYLFGRPIRALAQSAGEIAKGSLQPLKRVFHFKEYNVMVDAFNGMINTIRARNEAMQTTIARLDKIIRNVSLSASELTNVANVVSTSSQELSAGAVQQESVFMRLFDSVDLLEKYADSSNDMATQTNAIVGEAEQLAMAGNLEMHQLSEAMKAISGNSDDISKALHSIDNIAFQANILALNASVEAARAGRHGTGFTVVANEVRSLATRSAQLVVNTTGLLEKTDAKVSLGMELEQKTSKSFMQIEDIATRAAKLMATVTEQASDQSRIIDEIVTGLNEVAEIAKRNVHDASSNATISEELLRLAHDMRDMLLKSTETAEKISMPALTNFQV